MEKIFLRLSLFLLSFVTLNSCMSFNSIDLDPFDKKKTPELSAVWSDTGSKNKFFVLPIHGTIVSAGGEQGSGRGVVGPVRTESVLDDIAADPLARGLILDINSPGGSAAGSEDIYRLLLKFKRATNLPIVAYISDLAASGGYYIAQAADYVVSNPNGTVGSIGVISMFFSAEGLLKKKLELDFVVVKSGKFKDFGSPLRSMTSEERDYWQGLTMQYYEHFVGVVATGRNLENSQVKKVADGRVFHPTFAKEAKLIDEIGSLENAVTKLKTLAKVERASVYRSEGRDGFGGLFGMLQPSNLDKLSEKVLPEGFTNRVLYMAPF